jgi:hypothetical protein
MPFSQNRWLLIRRVSRPVPVAPAETLTLDRLAKPSGTALLVADEAGCLRAFN